MTSAELKTGKILIVDDEAGVLKALTRILNDESYEVHTALGGAAALQLLRQIGPVQLIIADYRMPGLTGVEFLQRIIQDWPDTRRVILSACTDTDTLLESVNMGRVHRFIAKPWDNEQLKAIIREMLHEYYALLSIRTDVEALANRNRLLSNTNQHLNDLLDNLLKTVRSDHGPAAVSTPPAVMPQVVAPPPHACLSSREFEVLRRTASGEPAKAIAHDLGLSIKTVCTYKKRLAEKLGFRNDVELISYALTHKLTGL